VLDYKFFWIVRHYIENQADWRLINVPLHCLPCEKWHRTVFAVGGALLRLMYAKFSESID
jgi:hypothetical protein